MLAAVSATVEASLDPGKGPNEDPNKGSLEHSTSYTLDVTSGQRKYGGPPPNWTDPPPPNGCQVIISSSYYILYIVLTFSLQVFCGRIPWDVYEGELIKLFEKYGTIWEIRLMMDRQTNLNRGFAFVTFTTPDAAQEAVRQVYIPYILFIQAK